MRFVKTYQRMYEELNISTYNSAAEKLNKLGYYDRAKRMGLHSVERSGKYKIIFKMTKSRFSSSKLSFQVIFGDVEPLRHLNLILYNEGDNLLDEGGNIVGSISELSEENGMIEIDGDYERYIWKNVYKLDQDDWEKILNSDDISDITILRDLLIIDHKLVEYYLYRRKNNTSKFIDFAYYFSEDYSFEDFIKEEDIPNTYVDENYKTSTFIGDRFYESLINIKEYDDIPSFFTFIPNHEDIRVKEVNGYKLKRGAKWGIGIEHFDTDTKVYGIEIEITFPLFKENYIDVDEFIFEYKHLIPTIESFYGIDFSYIYIRGDEIVSGKWYHDLDSLAEDLKDYEEIRIYKIYLNFVIY